MLLLLACAGAAQGQVLSRIACTGRAPTDLLDVKAQGVNGAIEVVWKPVRSLWGAGQPSLALPVAAPRGWTQCQLP